MKIISYFRDFVEIGLMFALVNAGLVISFLIGNQAVLFYVQVIFILFAGFFVNSKNSKIDNNSQRIDDNVKILNSLGIK